MKAREREYDYDDEAGDLTPYVLLFLGVLMLAMALA
jgi:hypothetical protein